jgi:hypothetical protein
LKPWPEAPCSPCPAPKRPPAVPALRPRPPWANPRPDTSAGLPRVSPQPERQRDGDRPVQDVAQQTQRSAGHDRPALATPVSAQLQNQRFWAPFSRARSQHLSRPEAMPDQPQTTSHGCPRRAAAGAHPRTYEIDVGCGMRPKFDVRLKIRDALLASSLTSDTGRSATGNLLDVGSPSPFCAGRPCANAAPPP